jgi:hypothetical protein
MTSRPKRIIASGVDRRDIDDRGITYRIIPGDRYGDGETIVTAATREHEDASARSAVTFARYSGGGQWREHVRCETAAAEG